MKRLIKFQFQTGFKHEFLNINRESNTKKKFCSAINYIHVLHLGHDMRMFREELPATLKFNDMKDSFSLSGNLI